MSGRVTVEGQVADKPGTQVRPDATIVVQQPQRQFVSRGGDKLAAAIERFALRLEDREALDLGSSTGGFVHVLLLNEVRRVHAIDVGHGQIDWNLRQDPRVVVREGVNARHLRASDLPVAFGIITADLSFISLRLVLPAIDDLLAPHGDAVLLVKPQFELGRGEVGRGVVRDPVKHVRAIVQVATAAGQIGLHTHGVAPSPLRGAKGNREFFLWLRKTATAIIDLQVAAELAAAPTEPT